MSSVICPNINSPEWKRLVFELGEKMAWKVFLANNESVPEMSVIDGLVEHYHNRTENLLLQKAIRLESTESKDKFIERATARIENGVYKERSGKLIQLSDSFNPETWWIENQEGLVTFDKGVRTETLFKFKDAHAKAVELNKKYKEDGATFEKEQRVYPKASVARSKNPSRDDRKIYRIKVTKPFTEPTIETHKNETDIQNSIDENINLLIDAFDELKDKTPTEIIDIARGLECADEVRQMLNLFSTKLEDNPTLKIEINETESHAYGQYDPAINTITLYRLAHVYSNDPNINSVGISLVHELVHAFTLRAFRNRTSLSEVEFAETIERLYDIAKKRTKYADDVFYEDAEEWLSYVLSDPTIMDEAMKMELSVWDRIVLAIQKLLGITSAYDLAFRTVVEYIQNNNVFVPSLQYTIKFRKNLEDNVFINDKNAKHKKIFDTLKAFFDKFEFNQADHTYVHKESGQFFNSVTETLVKNGIRSNFLSKDLEKRKIQLERRKRGGDIGDIIHGITEANLRKTAISIAADNGIKYTDKVVDQIEEILRQFKKPGTTILSEVLVADLDLLLAGTIDMVILDENNNAHIYDFKTKERGFIDLLKETKFGGSQLMSEKERFAFQLSMYKDMFEKMTGLDVEDLHIITLKPTVKDNVITDIELDRNHSSNGIVKVEYNQGVHGIYGLLKKEQGKSIKDEFEIDRSDEETFNEIQNRFKELVKKSKENLSELSSREEIIVKSIDGLIRKRQVLQKFGKRHELKVQDQLIDDLLAEKEVEKQLLMLVEFAHNSALRIYNEYNKYKEEGRDIPIKVLWGWRDSVFAFDAILNEEEGLERLLTREHGFKGGVEYRQLLKDTMELSAQIKTMYEVEGIDSLVDFLAPNYNGLYAELRLAKIKEYRRNRFLGKIPKDMTESEYVDKALDENEEDLQTRTKTLIRKELKKASRDIGVLTRWVYNLLDSSDPVVSAMIKAFVIKDEEQRIGALENRDKTAEVVRKLERWYKQKGKMPKSNLEFYDFMLEKVDGKLTGHIVKFYKSGMMEEYRDIIRLSKNFETEAQQKGYVKNWLDQNAPLQTKAFQEALWEFIEEEVAANRISQKDRKILHDNDFVVKNKLTIGEMVEKGFITFETGDIVGKWLGEYVWDFREPISKWKNSQFDQLKKILEDPTDARGDMYRHILKSVREADAMLPLNYRLDSRLPGVLKQAYEQVSEGQSIGDVIREGLNKQFKARVDETDIVRQEILDEAGNKRYFLPVHFTGRITKEVTEIDSEGVERTTTEFDPDRQSFDLASIYHKYWSMANDHNHKAEILPHMELAKFMVDKRSAIKRDPMGNAMFRKRTRGREDADLPEEESLINNTNLKDQLHDWFLACVYGSKRKEGATIFGLDSNKLLDTMNSYVAVNLLGLNTIAGTANILLGETLQRIETFSKEYISPKDFLYADKYYLRTLKGMLGDVGARDARSIGTHLIERFGIFDEYGDSDMGRNTRIGQLASMDTLFFTSKAGEHYMQGRFLFGLLAGIKAYDKDGNHIGRMIDQYELKDNKLVIKDIVDLEKSKWTERDQLDFTIKTRGILSRLHGEYSSLGRIAIQRMALGRMAYLFRHFIVPGYRRRWGRKEYIERLGQYVEGNYITTGKFVGVMGSKIFGKNEEDSEEAFFGRLISNLQSFKMSMFKEEWSTLTDHEKSNIYRTLNEVGILISLVLLANIISRIKPDEDEEWEKRFWAFLSYQIYRLQNELMFFTPKLDSAMSILRSPAAATSFAENLIKLSGQIFNPMDVYESGPWKGRPKIIKTLSDMSPGLRQYYRLRDIKMQIAWMQSSGLGGRKKKKEDEVTYTDVTD